MAYNVNLFILSGTAFKIPNDWNNGSNQIQCLGSGGTASVGYDSGTPFYQSTSGGGGAFASSTNLPFVPGSTKTIQVGAGIDTCFGGSTLGTSTVGAQAASGQTAGTAAASVGQVKFSGGNGVNAGTSIGSSASGGGAAGPNGAGSTGSGGGNPGAETGGAADGGTVAGGSNAGGSGLSGTEFDATHGCGSGGGANTGNILGGNGGNYGGGAGAACRFAGTFVGTSGQGLIMISYNPISPAANMIGL